MNFTNNLLINLGSITFPTLFLPNIKLKYNKKQNRSNVGYTQFHDNSKVLCSKCLPVGRSANKILCA